MTIFKRVISASLAVLLCIGVAVAAPLTAGAAQNDGKVYFEVPDDWEDVGSVYFWLYNKTSGEEVYTEAGSPGLLVDSTVLLLGDTTPIRYFDGKNTYAYSDDISYYSEPNTVLIETDANHFRYYITGNSKGKSTVIGSREGKELKKDIYVLDSKTATNSVLCDTEKIVFGVTASGAGAANIQVTVEGKEGKDLEARIYSNVGRDKTGNVWVTATGKWEDNVLHATLTNYLSPDKSGEIVVVITEKGDPLKLVGFTRIPVEAP